jgi:hypothetical protein
LTRLGHTIERASFRSNTVEDMATGGPPPFDLEQAGDEEAVRDMQYDDLPYADYGSAEIGHLIAERYDLLNTVDQMAEEIKQLRGVTHRRHRDNAGRTNDGYEDDNGLSAGVASDADKIGFSTPKTGERTLKTLAQPIASQHLSVGTDTKTGHVQSIVDFLNSSSAISSSVATLARGIGLYSNTPSVGTTSTTSGLLTLTAAGVVTTANPSVSHSLAGSTIAGGAPAH